MESIIRQEFYSMITSNAEAIDRLKQLLDNIDDEIETHVRERDFFIVSLTNATKPCDRSAANMRKAVH